MTSAEGGRNARRLVYIAVLLSLIGVSLTAEWRSLIRPDTGFLLDAAGRVLDGERLYVDVVEINPPLIVGLNMLAVSAARWLGVSEILVYRGAVVLVLLASLLVSDALLRRLFPAEPGLRSALTLLFGFVLFPLSAQDFGEREHLVLALLLPYLLLATARALGRDMPRALAASLGIGAAVAFALKPHFLLVWLSVELYLRRTRRVGAAAALPETLAIGGLLAAYGLTILVLTPEYLGLVRLLAGPYNRFLHDPFLHLLVTGPGVVLALFALLAGVALRPQARHPELWTAIAVATAACLLAGAVQQKGLRYHFYPSFALGSVLLGLTVVDVTRPLGNRVRVVYRRLAAAVLAATVLVVCVQNVAVAAGAGRDSDRDQFDELVRTVRSHAGRNGVFVMSYHLRSAYPLINYSGARSASRFPHLWILASEYADELGSARPLRYHDEADMAPVERYLNQAVVEDFQRHRPDLLVVFRHARDLPVNGLRRLDYIRYFVRDPRMSRMLGDYQLIRELGDFLVYQRVPPGGARTGPAPTVTTGTQDVVGVQESGVHLRIADPTTLMAVLTFLTTLLVMARRDDERRASGAPGE